MRILLVSDTHGDLAPLLRLPALVGVVDALLHGGDYMADVPALARLFRVPQASVWTVAGNCDYPDIEPTELVLALSGVRVLLVHGHRHDVKHTLQGVYERALETGAQLAVFGHSHVAVLRRNAGIWLVNPGSPGFPRLPGTGGSVALLTIDKGEIAVQHLDV